MTQPNPFVLIGCTALIFVGSVLLTSSSTFEPIQVIQEPDRIMSLWRDHFGAAYDQRNDRIVIYGGNRNNEVWLDDTWVGTGNNWTEIKQNSPPGRASLAMVFDPVRSVTLMFGGVSKGGILWGDTWQFFGDQWKGVQVEAPSPRYSPAMGFDEFRGVVVFFGGCGKGDDILWEWDGSWKEIDVQGTLPPDRCRSQIVYDPIRKTMIMFGGYGQGGVLNDMWEWNGKVWKMIERNVMPSPRDNHVMVTDVLRKRVILFGGWAGRSVPEDAQVLGDTWIWDGQNWKEFTGSGPSAREMAAAVYNTRQNTVVLFGGRGTGGVTLDDLWTFDGTSWRNEKVK